MENVPLPDLVEHSVPEDVACRHSGGPHSSYTFGEINQLPPVAGVPYYKDGVGKIGTADCVGKLKLAKFQNGSPGCKSIIVMMDDII